MAVSKLNIGVAFDDKQCMHRDNASHGLHGLLLAQLQLRCTNVTKDLRLQSRSDRRTPNLERFPGSLIYREYDVALANYEDIFALFFILRIRLLKVYYDRATGYLENSFRGTFYSDRSGNKHFVYNNLA
jgi:hypothetical protein